MVLEKTVVHPPPQGFALNLPGRLNVSLAETGTQVMLNDGMSFGDDAADSQEGVLCKSCTNRTHACGNQYVRLKRRLRTRQAMTVPQADLACSLGKLDTMRTHSVRKPARHLNED